MLCNRSLLRIQTTLLIDIFNWLKPCLSNKSDRGFVRSLATIVFLSTDKGFILTHPEALSFETRKLFISTEKAFDKIFLPSSIDRKTI